MRWWRPSVRSCARSGDYPSVSWWAQAAQSGVYGREATHPFHGGHRRHDDAYIGAIGDLRSNCVLGQETTHPFHGGHRRHDQDGGDLRSGCVLGQETGTIIFVSVRAQPARSWWNRGVGLGSTPSLEGDGVTGGWCRNPSVSRRGKMETFGQIACSVRRPARSYLFRYGHSRTIRMVETFGQVGCSVGRLPIHFMVGTGGTIRMRAQPARPK